MADQDRRYFGSWKIKRTIGTGSFGTVYEIEREDFGQIYRSAMKVISIPQDASAVRELRNEGMDEQSIENYFLGFVNELVSEFALMAQMKGNSNIVSYEDHEVIEKENHGRDICIRMELLIPLDEYIRTNPLQQSDVVRLGLDLCNALTLCQKHNIIHRDIKPENIFVSENGDFKLGDFGIARTAEKTSHELSQKGTYTYMAPEIYKGQPYGPNVDLYSLGMVMYRLLNNNRVPFLPAYPSPITHADREAATMVRLAGEPMPAPANAGPQLAALILKACAYDPAQRYALPQAFRRDLLALGESAEGELRSDSTEVILSTSRGASMKTVSMFGTGSTGGHRTGKSAVGTGRSYTDIPQAESRTPAAPINRSADSERRLQTATSTPAQNTAGSEPSKVRICPQCGTLNQHSERTCTTCGSVLEVSSRGSSRKGRQTAKSRISADTDIENAAPRTAAPFLNRRMLQYGAVWLIALITFQVLVFVIPGPAKFSGSFWIGYLAITATFLLQLICTLSVLREENNEKLFYKLPIISVSYTGLLIMLAAGTLCMTIPALPNWIGIVVCVLVLAATGISIIAAHAVGAGVNRVAANVKQQTFLIKSLAADAESLMSKTDNSDIRTACKKVYEALRYSDPVSNDALAEIESLINGTYSKFKGAVLTKDLEAAVAIVPVLESLISEREAKCKLAK